MKKVQQAKPIKRFVAFAIDWYLSSLCLSLVFSIIKSIEENSLIITGKITDLTNLGATIALVLGLALVILYFYYYIIYDKI